MAQTKASSWCSVPLCSTSKLKQPYLSFHCFPSDKQLLKKWVQAIRREEGKNFTIKRGSTYVCSLHFKSEDFTPAEGRKRLKKDAVPCRFKWNEWQETKRSSVSERTSTHLNGDVREIERNIRETEKDSVAEPVAPDHDYNNPAAPVFEKSRQHNTKTMDFKWMTVSAASTGGHLQCSFCKYQCKSNATYQIHIGTSHPFHCEEMDVGRLGKIIFYQKSAKLFHCHECFFTGKSYTRVYDHVLVSHSFSRKDKTNNNRDPKDYLSDSNDSKDVPDNDNNDEERPEGGDGEAKPRDAVCLQAPAKFAALNSAKNEEAELYDEDSQHSSSPSQPPKRKREVASDEEAPPDGEDFPDFAGKPEREADETREEKQAEETLLSKYFRRIGGRYYCNICNWRGKMKGFIFHHVSKKHNIPRPFACKECSKSFLLESMLLSHVSMFHKQGIYQCPYCAFKSNYLRGVRRHLNNCNVKQGEWSYDSDEQD
ncbi:chromosome alignment-maintaining phosphoprotein 1-like isoform X1 [Anguilla anguilla]|uniref:chromosome alignment-maintaining phosphoprotein 1-like isoform X1 n=2 Tax=Anguilla anguilla TaxID=7936 RepID=UPI0015AA5DFD|nr:chromosome alignment-maintaining phosphoprotein 1-like isoform X1 [Anguilla anguilla]